MARFIRDILATLSYEPAAKAPADRDELSRLDQRLAHFAGRDAGPGGAIAIQPDECSVWDGNPRDQPGLTADSCRSLIESIASEGGNRIPVLVRLNPPGSDRPYQLLVGSRRRFAVGWLNHNGRTDLRLTALVVDLSDEEAFRLADIENRERADISELDRARSYQHAVDRFYGGVQSRMAEALNLSNSQLSRLIALAQLPEEVINAFATRDELRVRYSELLTPLLRQAGQRGRMIAEAQLIGEQQQALAREGDRLIPPATVLARLREAAMPQSQEEARDIAIMAGGARIGRAKPSRGGGLTVDLSIAEDADLDELLARLRETIVAVRATPLMS
ncbi:ParB/RepB/Spo0J family partition protein [Sphingobium sp. JS3065]|uniref:ParB/RepB/Spo0J family partition protein n=1 Tax=Sphingobium sp. JS3065 TaxID=2970925 RepID=UPI00226535D9|nr:ParB/RepB/Spo0J family partition protein [Sphingobium sp. JS3065]UZW57210.1 ParB/RepB/Spo0J family partition protein [Sphingobium sp. JS3065]